MDRLAALRAQNRVTGIDVVHVSSTQTELDCYFHDPQPGTLAPLPLFGDVLPSQITIQSTDGGESVPLVSATDVAWQARDGRDVLVVTTANPGDFSLYTFDLNDERVDPFYNDVPFSFKASCPSQLDCAPPTHICPRGGVVDFPINYLARDFESFRQALLDFASVRYPTWQDRLEADAGVMFAELLSAIGDDMAYYQDRVGREKAFETASERRSIRKHARLLDYEIDDGRAATTWIDVTCAPGQTGAIPAGMAVVDMLRDPATGRQPQRWFEIGRGLDDTLGNVTFAVSDRRNAFTPHIWDDAASCLPVGSTQLHIEGAHKAALPFDDLPPNAAPGKWMLLQTAPTDASIAPRAWMVRVVTITDAIDPVLNEPITLLSWEPAQATPFELDLAVLAVRGNLLPATAGRQYSGSFTIGPSTDPQAPPNAIARNGHDGTRAYVWTLPGSESAPLGWLPLPFQPDLAPATRQPEIFVQERASKTPWTWRRALLGTNAAEAGDDVFTLEDGSWRRVVGYRRPDGEFAFRDYAAPDGVSIRFGDDEFGRTPTEDLVFDVTYRLMHGADDNVGAGTLQSAILPAELVPVVIGVTNPLPAISGTDPESNDRVRRLAPYAYSTITYRAVKPEDYAASAKLLDWVEQAGATMRWTGSWSAVFVTPDPVGTFLVTPPQRVGLSQQLDRYRQTGREVYVLDPIYANLDLKIYVCVTIGALHLDADGIVREDVEAAILRVLYGSTGIRAVAGFFAHDNFTFGTPLERSALEAKITAVPGVKAVERIEVRRRGWHDWRDFSELTYAIGPNEMIRVVNDARMPERGSVQIFPEVST